MNRIVTVLLLVFSAWLSAGAFARPADHADLFNGAEINWRDARSGIYEATQTGKPVIMVFHATWCSACKKYRAVFSDAAIVAAAKDFVMILVDADKDKEINGAFSPDGSYVPRTLFVDTAGDVSTSLVGKDPSYRYSIDVGQPDELLALMLKAKKDGFGPAGRPAGDAPAELGKGT
jgi:protein-disulfide reductase (glutathione)